MNIQEYLIEQKDINWSDLLQSWNWLLPVRFTLWLVNRFADLILVFDDGSVNLLRTDTGDLIKIADSRDHFSELIDVEDNALDWLAIPLVEQCVSAGMLLNNGECYGFKVLPLVGGTYEVDNIYKAHISEYIPYLADIHQQLHNVPDGTEVEIDFGKV